MSVRLDPEQKLAYSVEEAVQASPWKKTTIYDMMADGRLKWRKQAGKRYIMREDLQALLLAPEPFQDEHAA